MHGQNHIIPFVLFRSYSKMKFLGKFSKNPYTSNFTKFRPVRTEVLHAGRQTDMTNIIVAFGNSANAAKKLR